MTALRQKILIVDDTLANVEARALYLSKKGGRNRVTALPWPKR